MAVAVVVVVVTPPKHSRIPLRVRVLFLIPIHKSEHKGAEE